MSRGNAPRTIFTFILGIGVGALAALLLAPKAGKELRSDIANGVSDGVNQVNAAHKGMKKRAQKIVALAQDHGYNRGGSRRVQPCEESMSVAMDLTFSTTTLSSLCF
jgi:gas vesicle protein